MRACPVVPLTPTFTPLAIQWSTQGAGFAFAVFARMAIGVALAALLLGQTLNGEEITARIWLGAALIAGGLALHQWTGLVGLARRAD